MAEKPYTVLVCDPKRELRSGAADDQLVAEDFWEAHGPILAPSAERAIEKLREMASAFKANTDLLYVAVPKMRPRQMRKEIIERWALGFADEDEKDPKQEQLA